MGTGCDTQHTHLSILPVKLETQQKQTMNKKKLGLSKNKKQNLGTERALGIEARGSVLRLDAKAQSMGEKMRILDLVKPADFCSMEAPWESAAWAG